MSMTVRAIALFASLLAAAPASARRYATGTRARLLGLLQGGLAEREQALAPRRLADGRMVQLGVALSSPRGEIVMPLSGVSTEPLAVTGRPSRAALRGARANRIVADVAGVAVRRSSPGRADRAGQAARRSCRRCRWRRKCSLGTAPPALGLAPPTRGACSASRSSMPRGRQP